MARLLHLAMVVLAVAAGGCASGGSATGASRDRVVRGVDVPTTEQVQSAAPALAKSLNDWRVSQRGNERLVLRGPTFVGVDGLSAQETKAMGAALAGAVNQHADPGLRFLPAGGDDEAAETAGTVLDARAGWERAAKHGSKRQARLVLELVDPTNGRTVFSADSSVAPAVGPAGARAEAARPAADSTPPPTAEPPTQVAVGERPISAPESRSEQDATAPSGEKPPAAAVPPSTGSPAPEEKPAVAENTIPVEASPRVPPPAQAEPAPEPVAAPPAPRPEAPQTPPPRDSAARRAPRPDRRARASVSVSDERGEPRRRSPVVPLAHGVIYFTNTSLADRVIILQERTAVTSSGDLSVRFVMASRKGKKTLEIRCDFYDEQGAAAGTVQAVELPIREGVPATISLASRKPAARYVLFVKD